MFPSKRDSNQPVQQQRQPRKIKISLVATSSKSRYDTLQYPNNKGADQTAQAGLHFCCSQTPEDRFSRVEVLVQTYVSEKW